MPKPKSCKSCEFIINDYTLFEDFGCLEEENCESCYKNFIQDPLDDFDIDQISPYNFSEGFDWSKWDFENDPDWR